MARITRARSVNLPGDVIFHGEMPNGGLRVLIPLYRLIVSLKRQRKARMKQIKRLRRLDWDFLGELIVCEAWKWIDPVMVGKFHVAEGGTRLEWFKQLFPTNKFTEAHKAAGLIPKGYSVNDDVMVACTIYDRHPLDLFFGYNDKDKVKSYESFDLKLKDSEHFQAETELVDIFQKKFGIKVVVANGRCGARHNGNTTVSAHTLMKYFLDSNTGQPSESGRKLIIDTLTVITSVYKRPAGRRDAMIEYAALTYKFMQAIAEVIRDSGYDRDLIIEALVWAHEHCEETSEFILNHPENKAGGGNAGKDSIVKYILRLINQFLDEA